MRDIKDYISKHGKEEMCFENANKMISKTTINNVTLMLYKYKDKDDYIEVLHEVIIDGEKFICLIGEI